jgi:Domain of unknown function (DUF222)/HNH endonuclease
MATPTDTLREAARLLALVGVGAATGDSDLLTITAEVEGVGRLVDALRSSTASEIARRSDRALGNDGLAARHGFRTPTSMITSLTLVSGRAADRRSRVGQLVASPALDTLAAAMGAGSIDTDAAESIALALTPVLASALAQTEPAKITEEVTQLVEFATTQGADEVAAAARIARDRLDALGIEKRETDLHAQRYLRFGRPIDGLVPLRGMLPPEEAGIVLSLFDARTSVRRKVRFEAGAGSAGSASSGGDGTGATDGDASSDAAELDPDGELREQAAGPMTIVDERTMDQRRADTFVEICRIAASTLHDAAGDSKLSKGAGTLVVTISHDDLMAGIGPARVDGVGESISASAARRIACNAGILPMVLGSKSQPLDLGVSERLFSTGQRRAIAERDRGCAAPGCDAPPSWTEVHHILWWSRGGPTDYRNGVLLCSFHHHRVHDGVLRVDIDDGLPVVRRALPIGAETARAAA